MSYWWRSYLCGIVVFIASVRLVNSAEGNLDRTLEKIAAAMLREYPELRGDARTSLARATLVKEFRSYEVHEISAEYLKKIKRQKVDLTFIDWVELVERFEKADFQDSKRKYLLARAKSNKLRSEEFYVMTRLLKAYYASALEEREDLSKLRLRRVGKAFTAYLREHKVEPKSLERFVGNPSDRLCLDPYTGELKEWVFIAASKAEVRGANKHRLVAFSPFKSGRLGVMRWVSYKGGTVGDWKETTLLAAVANMHADDLKLAAKEQSKLAESKKMKKVVASAKVTKPKKLEISIRELW